MRHFLRTLLVFLIGGAALIAQTTQHSQQRVAPNEIKWPANGPVVGTSGVGGMQTIALKGDPTKPGLYTIRFRIPPNTKIEAHSHKDDRSGVVLSGVWYFAYGNQFNQSALK